MGSSSCVTNPHEAPRAGFARRLFSLREDMGLMKGVHFAEERGASHSGAPLGTRSGWVSMTPVSRDAIPRRRAFHRDESLSRIYTIPTCSNNPPEVFLCTDRDDRQMGVRGIADSASSPVFLCSSNPWPLGRCARCFPRYVAPSGSVPHTGPTTPFGPIQPSKRSRKAKLLQSRMSQKPDRLGLPLVHAGSSTGKQATQPPSGNVVQRGHWWLPIRPDGDIDIVL